MAAVFDPRPDCDIYIDMAREASVAITHIFETHIHADLVSGSRELCARLDSAKIYVEPRRRREIRVRTRESEGRRSVSRSAKYWSRRGTHRATRRSTFRTFLAESDHPETPWGMLTGDSLFVSSAGRPDLLGENTRTNWPSNSFRRLRDFYLKLPDHVMIYPNHGAGSPCGADIGERLSSTIGYERKFNKFLQFDDVKSFTDYAIKTAPPVPHYYPGMKQAECERTGDSWQSSARSGSAAESVQGSD